MIHKKEAIHSLCPSAGFSLSSNGEIIDWHNSEITKPTEAEIQAKITELQADYDSKQYQRDRQYPSIGDQLDMIYWDKVNGTETWKEAIEKVKADNPKPE